MRRTLIATCIAAGICVAATVVHSQPAPTSPLRTDPVSFREVVKGVLPAVVSLDAKAARGKVRRTPEFADEGGNEGIRKFFEELERRQQQGPITEQSIGFGSGFIVSGKGIVLTNNHVVENADSVEIILADGRKFVSRDIRGDQKTDLAIVRFDPKGAKLPALDFADSSQMEIGDRVLAIGAPFGLSGSVTQGIISAKGRDLGLNRYDDFIQTDAAINPGNSGGPLVNLEGKVVGVNSAIQSRTGGWQGVGMAISSNMAKSVMNALIRDGEVKRPYIGIEAGIADPAALARVGATDGGVYVAGVRPKTPADRGGIKADDIIISINKKPIKEFRELTRAIANQNVGDTIEVGLIREGRKISVNVVLEEEPKGYGAANPVRPLRRVPFEGEAVRVPALGMALGTIGPAEARRLGIEQNGAAVIVAVDRNGLAASGGLVPGAVITRVSRNPVLTAEAAREAIETALDEDESVLLHVNLNGRVALVQLSLK
jgi:serine protease Do